jgi:tetratricopeptide (TPR) repeat protein
MISPTLRFILMIAFFIGGFVAIFMQLGNTIAIVFFATALIMLLGHFRYGPMVSILLALRQGKIARADELLQSIKRPNWLSNRYQGYYYFAQSLVATHQKDVDSATSYANLALKINTLHDKERAILVYNLARMAYEHGDYAQAQQHYLTLQGLSVEDLHLKKRVAELEVALKDKGI